MSKAMECCWSKGQTGRTSEMSPLSESQQAVLLVAEGLHRAFPKRGWRRTHPMDFVAAAREAVAILLWLPEGRALSNRVLEVPTSVLLGEGRVR
jgi:hypothetical protein